MAEAQLAREVDVAALIDNHRVSWFQVSIIAWSCLVMFLEGYDMQVVAYAAPSIIQEWQVSKAYFGPVFSFGLFGYLLGATLLSNLADQFGRKKLIVGGVISFGTFTLLAAYASTLPQLMALRFIAGVGLGCSVPTVIALAAEYVPAGIRATIITVLFVGYNSGSALGGVIAANSIPAFGWPVMFKIGGIVPIVLGIVLIFVLPESVRFLAVRRNRSDRIATILAKLRRDQQFDNARFVVREERRSGLPLKHLFTEGRAVMTLLLWCAFIFSLLGHHLLTNWLPTVLVSSGVSLALATTAGAMFHAGGGVGGVLLGWLMDKRGVLAIAVAFIIAAPLTVLIASAGVSVYLLLTVAFLTGAAMLGGQVGLNALSGTFYPTFIRSTGAGWAFGVGRIGSIIGPLLGGALMAMNVPTRLLMVVVAVPMLCCAAAIYLLKKVPVVNSAAS